MSGAPAYSAPPPIGDVRYASRAYGAKSATVILGGLFEVRLCEVKSTMVVLQLYSVHDSIDMFIVQC